MPLVQTLEEAQRILQRVQEAPEVCYDSETSGLDPHRCHIVGHVFTFSPNPNDSYYLPVRHAGGGNIPGCHVPDHEHGWKGDRHPVEMAMQRLETKVWLGHNLKFDMRMLHRHKIWLPGLHRDTSLAAPLIDEYMRSYSLEALSKEAGVQVKKGEPLYEHIARTCAAHYAPKKGPGKDAMGHYWRTDARDEVVWDYAAGDGTSTWQLFDKQAQVLEEQELWRVFNVESRLLPVLVRMENTGIRIDEERLDEVAREVQSRLDEILREFPEGFNVRGEDVKRLILDSGVDPDTIPRTKPSMRAPEGNMSFNEDFLKTIPIGQRIIAARKLQNLRDSFIAPMREVHMVNGRVHTSFNQLRSDDYGTITGRLSSSMPNLQQVPKRNKELGKLFRSIFVPDEGMIWGSVDYSQCEPRLLAFYGRVKVLLEGYRAAETVDAHTAVSEAAGIDRDAGKRMNQSLLTGAGYNKIVSMLSSFGGTAAARDMVNKYFDTMPEIRGIQQYATQLMRNPGYAVSLLGRRARCRPGKEYVGLNRLLQCGNADILKLKMVECADYLESEGNPIDILSNCHDANEFQYPPEMRKHYDKCLEIMADFGPGAAIELDVPMEVDSGLGRNWAEATYGNDKEVFRGRHFENGQTTAQLAKKAERARLKAEKEAAKAALEAA